jgi:hypothetical protein
VIVDPWSLASYGDVVSVIDEIVRSADEIGIARIDVAGMATPIHGNLWLGGPSHGADAVHDVVTHDRNVPEFIVRLPIRLGELVRREDPAFLEGSYIDSNALEVRFRLPAGSTDGFPRLLNRHNLVVGEHEHPAFVWSHQEDSLEQVLLHWLLDQYTCDELRSLATRPAAPPPRKQDRAAWMVLRVIQPAECLQSQPRSY